MPYQYFGRIGDIWKHLPLCEFLAIEQPNSYIETNAGYPEYSLTGTPEQDYGIGMVERRIDRCASLEESVYWRLLKRVPGNEKTVSRYLGSAALAMHVLGPRGTKFTFYDLEEEALCALRSYSRALSLTDVVCLREDSRSALAILAGRLAPDCFVHIDPYFVHKADAQGNTYFSGFVRVAASGAKGILWYGFNTLGERARLHAFFERQPTPKGQVLRGMEIMSVLIGRHRPVVNPGVLGCGILVANLSDKSQAVFSRLAHDLVQLYQGATMFQSYPGDLRCEEFQVRI